VALNLTIFLATITPAVAGERCDSGKTIVATVSTKVIIGDVNDALQSSNPMIKNIGPGSKMCTDDSTNIVWAGQIPPGLIAVRFTIGLRSYQGFVKEADFSELSPPDRDLFNDTPANQIIDPPK
jgi:hypothetical protein